MIIDIKVLGYTMLFVILIAILHTLNLILRELRQIKISQRRDVEDRRYKKAE